MRPSRSLTYLSRPLTRSEQATYLPIKIAGSLTADPLSGKEPEPREIAACASAAENCAARRRNQPRRRSDSTMERYKYTVTNLKDLQPGSATARSFCEQLHRRSFAVIKLPVEALPG